MDNNDSSLTAPGAIKSPTHRVTSVRLLAAGAFGLLLYFAHVAFIPVALALLFSLILSAPVEALHGMRVPRSIGAALIMAAILGILVALGNFVSEPAQQWYAAAPHTVRLIEKKIRPFAQVMARVGELRNSAGNIGALSVAGAVPATIAPKESAPVMLLDATRNAVLSCATVVILTLFLLAGGPPMMARLTSALASDLTSAHIITIEKVRSEVGRYYVTTALINIGLGIATAGVMMLCGMPNPFLWGTMAALLNFIPYAGSTTTLIVLTAVAIISFDGLGRVIAVAGGYLAVATIEGQFVQPLLVGRRLQLNPVLVFLTLWFGGFFWGIAGIILATPTLVALKVVATYSSGGEQLLAFLSPHANEEENDTRQEPVVEEPLVPGVSGDLQECPPLPPSA
jgi:predicted PurR-regulated permease PerM